MTDTNIASQKRFGDAPYFVFCDHASNVIPAEMNCLGMPDDLLATHIGWDIGAGALAFALGEALAGETFACEFSRLVIDANRATDSNDIIPATSDQIPIPGNQMLSAEEKSSRIKNFHTPYHERLSAALDDFSARHADAFVISVHSFTNRLMGAADDRPWKVGLLWREDETSAQLMIAHLEEATDWTIGNNQPYDARIFNYSIDRHAGPRGLPHLTLEVRQDLIHHDSDILSLAAILAKGVRTIAAQAIEKSRDKEGGAS